MWEKITTDERGVSNLVGVILLVATSITGALLLLAAGQTTIQDTQNEQNAEVVSDTFKQADALFQSVPRNESDTGSRSVDLPRSVQGDVETKNDTSYRIRLNGDTTCDSGERPLGSIQYAEDGTVVGYEGGGVWESTEGGAVIESPPGLTYDDGSLNVQFNQVSGNVTDSDELTAQVNRSSERSLNEEMSLLLYTTLVPSNISSASSYSLACPPTEVENATLFVNNSVFAGAWARYAEDRFDDRRVEVEPSPASARENVSMTFELGDVSVPEFSVRNVTTERHSASGPLQVNGTVQNVGGLDGEQEVTLLFQDGTGTSVTTPAKNVSLDGGESERVSFSVPVTSVSPGEYDATIVTENDSASETLELDSSPYVTDFEVDTASASVSPPEAGVGDDVSVEATIENTGGMTGTRTVTFEVDGSVRNTTTLTLDPGETETLTYPLPTTEDGSHSWEVTTGGSSQSDTVLVGTEPTFAIQDLDAPSGAPAGNTFSLEATINNTGQLDGTREVNLTIQHSNGTSVADDDDPVTIDGTITDSSDAATVDVSETISTPGNYEYRVDTGDVVQTGSFTVGPAEYPNFIVTSLRFSDDPVLRGNHVTIEADIRNTGDTDDTQEISLSTERETLTNPERHLDPGDEATVTTTVEVESPAFVLGEANEITARTGNNTVTQHLEVLEEESISESDNGQIIANERLDVSVQLLGAELEGGPHLNECPDPWTQCPGSFWNEDAYDRFNIINDPVEMSLVVNGDSQDLWNDLPGEGDVNHPEAEQELLSSGNPYNKTATLEAGDRALVTATSYRCSEYPYTDVVFDDLVTYGGSTWDAVGRECETPTSERLSIDGEGEDPRVVIRKNGESIRGSEDFQPQAAAYQRNVKQMLQGRLDDSGYLDLAPGERVLIYELSDPDATIEQASDSGDPDYNDAVVLFKVLSKNRTVAPPASYEITDLDAPGRVRTGDSETITATINNTGGQSGETDVAFSFDGTTEETVSTGTLDPGEETTVSFDVPTGSTGTFDYTVSVVGDPDADRSGQLTVGSPPSPYFQVSEFTPAKTAVERGTDVTVDATIDNVGSASDTQTIELRNVTGSTDAVVDSESGVSLAGGTDTTVTFELPTPTNGTLAYTVSTDDTRAPAQRIYVDESHVTVNQTEVGLTTYNESELIERKSVPRLTVELNNDGGLGAERDVTLTVENQSGGTTNSKTRTVTVGDGEIRPPYPGYVTFDTASSPFDLSEGYYTYTIEVDDDGSVEDTWTGELFVHEDGTVSQSPNSDSPVNVDSGQIEVGS